MVLTVYDLPTLARTAAELDHRHLGRRGGRPRVFDEEMLSQARRLRDDGMPVPEAEA